MSAQTLASSNDEIMTRIDSLINDFLQVEYELKLAIVNDNSDVVDRLDNQICILEAQIHDYDYQCSYEKKRLGTFLVDHYLLHKENEHCVPEAVSKKLKEIIG